MAEFNKVWVNCVEDDNLYGKYGYFSDSIDKLRSYVTNDLKSCWGKLSRYSSSNDAFPFVREENDTHYRFFYHDPGLMVLADRIVTNRELSRWLSHGNGECHRIDASGRRSACLFE